jgi:hypothetical protein
VYDRHTVGRIGGSAAGSVTRSIGVQWFSRIHERGDAAALAGDHALADTHECLLGRECYATAIRVSALACVLALLLSVIAGIRRERTAAARSRRVA